LEVKKESSAARQRFHWKPRKSSRKETLASMIVARGATIG
jgi:hypothetical protein